MPLPENPLPSVRLLPYRNGQIRLSTGVWVEVYQDMMVLKSPALSVMAHATMTKTEKSRLATLLKDPKELGAPTFDDPFEQDPTLSSQDFLRQYADVIEEAREHGAVIADDITGEDEGDEQLPEILKRIATYIDWLESKVAEPTGDT